MSQQLSSVRWLVSLTGQVFEGNSTVNVSDRSAVVVDYSMANVS